MRGQAAAKSCDLLFAEFYTNPMPALNMENLRAIVGKNVILLTRSDVEERADAVILSTAAYGRAGFLVPGDPMVATTHVDLRLRAQRLGISTRIVHAASVTSAVAGATGLQSYKFGRTVTVPVTWQGEFPDSVYLPIKDNLAFGLHSLVLLEVDVENNRHVTIAEALRQLMQASQQRGDSAITAETLVVGVARLEAPDMKVKAGLVSELMEIDFGTPPFALIFPSRLHFVEAEALEAFCGARREPVAGKR